MKSIITFLLCITTLGTFAQINFEHDIPFQQALDKAKSEGKIVFMDCFTTWCGPCRKLAAESFTDKEVGDFFNTRFVNVKVDMEKGEGPELAAQFGVRAYPTLLWINPDGSVKHRVTGFVPAANLLYDGQKASDTLAEKLTAMRAEYNNGKRDAAFVNSFLNALISTGGSDDAVLKSFINNLSVSELQNATYAKTIFNATNDGKSPGLAYVLKNRTLLEHIVGGKEVYARKLNTIADKTINNAIIKKDEGLLNEATSLLKNINEKNADERIARAQVDFAARMENWAAFDKAATDYIKNYAAKNAQQLSDISWTYYLNMEDKKLLAKAAKWAHTAVELLNNTENNTTYAYLNYKLGDLKEAELACDYALLRAKEDGGSDLSAKGLKALIQKEKK